MNPNDATERGFGYQPQSSDPHQWVKKLIGNYNVLDVIGQGNMAVLYKVSHCDLNKAYALKVLRVASNETDMERFLQEGRILAHLEHPNIVKVYQMSRAGNIPYLVLELIEGQDVDSLIKNRTLTIDSALEYTRQIASALQYIHEQQIIHRDIKPTNIMITKDGVAKLTDFGIAKFLKKPLNLTRTGYTMGSVLYMSPEQINQAQAPDWRTDIYSLGAALFCMLTGMPPFPGVSHFQIMQDIIGKPLPTLFGKVKHKQVARLDALLRRMLAKNPEDRYQQADEVITEIESIQTGMSPEDLSLELGGDLMNLKPDGLWRYSVTIEQGRCELDIGSGAILRAMLRDHKGDAAMDELFCSMSELKIKSRCKIEGISSHRELDEQCRVSTGQTANIQQTVLNIWKTIDEGRRDKDGGDLPQVLPQETDAQPETEMADNGTSMLSLPENIVIRQQPSLYAMTSMLELPDSLGIPSRRQQATEPVETTTSSQDATLLHSVGATTQLLPSQAKLVLQMGHTEVLRFAAWCADTGMLVSVDKNYVIKHWQLAAGQLISTLQLPFSSLNPGFSCDGKLVAVVEKDKVKIYDTHGGTLVHTLPIEFGLVPLTSALFSADGRLLVFATQKGIQIWDWARSARLHQIVEEDIVISLCFSPNGALLASGNTSGTVQLWDIQSGRLYRSFPGATDYVISLCFSRDGQSLASGSNDGTVKVWRLDADDAVPRVIPAHTDYVNDLHFSGDGKLLASASSDGTVKVWQTEDGRLRQDIPLAGRVILADIIDNDTLIAANIDGQAVLYKLTGEAESRTSLLLFRPALTTVALGSGARLLACGASNGSVQVWDLAAGKLQIIVPGAGKINGLSYDKNGDRLAWGDNDGTLHLWDGARLLDFDRQAGAIHDISFSDDGQALISGNAKGQLMYTDINQRSSKVLPTAKACVSLSLAHRKQVSAMCVENRVVIYDIDVKPVTQKISFPAHPFGLSISLSDNGKYLAFCSDLNKLVIVDVASGRTLKNFDLTSRCFRFSPDGRLFAFATGQTIHIWDVTKSLPAATCQGAMPGVVHAMAFSADNKILASVSGGAAQLWLQHDGRLLANLIGFDNKEWAVVTPDQHFDCSPGAEKYMHFVGAKADIYPCEQFSAKYRRPGLLTEVLAKH